ncbi:MAG: GNAT family N-acetyltransferase [Acidobacteria bacterium]|nr:GNAT family N-acetyltransferase [Acidobacteriota bacterium]
MHSTPFFHTAWQRQFKGALKPLTLADLNDLWHLDLHVFFDGEAYERETFRYLLTNPQVIARQIKTEDGQMVAFALAMIEPDGVGHITTVGVATAYRRRGLARLVLHEVERSFLARGVTTVRLEVKTDNLSAQRLYEHLGYVIVRRVPSYYSNGDDAYLMVRAIDLPAS